MMKRRFWYFVLLALAAAACKKPAEPTPTPTPPPQDETGPAVVKVGEVLPAWEEGWLDIHSINGGRGESFYYILPDGTTMLIDAAGAPQNEYTGDKTGFPSKPSVTVGSGMVIAHYIKHFAPKVSEGKIDYFMASHYHGDHIGAWRDAWQTTYKWAYNSEGGFVINGLPEVGMDIPIVKIIDRGDWGDRPSSEYFETGGVKRYQNYIKFVEWSAKKYGTVRETFQVGRDDQIVLKHDPAKYPGFSVRNIGAGGNYWTGVGTEVDSTYIPSAELETLIARINHTNNAAMVDGVSLTDLLAKRDCLKQRVSIMRTFLDNASAPVSRYSLKEIMVFSTVDVEELQKNINKIAKELREVDEKIQGANWTIDLM